MTKQKSISSMSDEEFEKVMKEVDAITDNLGFAILYFACFYPSGFNTKKGEKPRYWCMESEESKKRRKAVYH